MTKNNFTNKDLLIRIDERQQRLLSDIEEIKKSLSHKVTDDGEYQELRDKVNTLWDLKNKLIGYSAGAGATAALILKLIEKFIF